MSALALRIVACVAMLIDHIGYFTHITAFRIIGRVAFPLFAYLIYNGYCHTSSKTRYALRLLVFALLSQVPFSLFCYDRLWAVNGNVFISLLVALLCLWSVDVMRSNRVLRWVCLLPTIVICALYYKGVIVSDYGAIGVLMVLVFYFCDHDGIQWMMLTCFGFLAAVFYDYVLALCKQAAFFLIGADAVLPILSTWKMQQVFSVLALPLIFVYNGEKGKLPDGVSPRLVQYCFYLFYPVHQLILWLIKLL